MHLRLLQPTAEGGPDVKNKPMVAGDEPTERLESSRTVSVTITAEQEQLQRSLENTRASFPFLSKHKTLKTKETSVKKERLNEN